MVNIISKKKLNTDGIYFTGESSDDVTGSQYFIKFGDKQILLECGLYQSSSNSFLDSYKVNSQKFQFKPSEIDYLFILHGHVDHMGLVPRLIKEGFTGKIITTFETSKFMEALLRNCAFILQDEARVLSKRYKRIYSPIYSEDDVLSALELVETFEKYNQIYKLDDNVSFQWIENSHCVGAAQLQLILTNKTKTKKILYSSDIGSLKTRNHYVNDTKIPSMFNDVSIMESTYGLKNRIKQKTRAFDVEHLKVAVETTLERKGTVIFPAFSYSRTQELLTTLYELFNNDSNFTADVVVDSKLSCEICDIYPKVLNNENLILWEKVSKWKNVRFIKDKEESQICVSDKTPKIIISSSGFCTNGRILSYLSTYLQDVNSMVIFSGYVGDNPSYLSYRVKNYKEYKILKINKQPVENKSDCITLSTFSSHADHKDLVEYGSNLNTNKLVLVHGSCESKNCLKENLSEAISKNNKNYKVLCSSKGMVVHL